MTREEIEKAASAQFGDNAKLHNVAHIIADFAIQQVNAALEEAAMMVQIYDPRGDPKLIRNLKIK